MDLTKEPKNKFLVNIFVVLFFILLPIAIPLLIRSLQEKNDNYPALTYPEETCKPYKETGDLPAIKKHNVLRFIISKEIENYLISSDDFHPNPKKELIEALCNTLNIRYIFIQADTTSEAASMLTKGKGDILIDRLSTLRSLNNNLAFSLPIFSIGEIIVGKKGTSLNSTAELQNKTLAFKPQLNLAETAQSLKRRFNSIKTKQFPLFFTSDELLDLIDYGDTDYCLIDTYSFNQISERRANIEVAFDFQNYDQIIWAMRPSNEELISTINSFLRNYSSQKRLHSLEKRGDLSSIIKSGKLIFITFNERCSYYIWKGEKYGFEYELAKTFATKYGINLQVVNATNKNELFTLLLSSQGDIAGAFLTRKEISTIRGLIPSYPYNRIFTHIVGKKNNTIANLITNFYQTEITVIADTPAHNALKLAQEQGIVSKIKTATDSIPNQEFLIAALSQGTINLAAVEDYFYQLLSHTYTNIISLYKLPFYEEQCWAIKEKNEILVETVNSFLKTEFNKENISRLYQKYFILENNNIETLVQPPLGPASYELLIRYYAYQTKLDWRLITALIHQESRFNPNATSKAGACGLMQIMPSLAETYGFNNIYDPAVNINVGTKYFATLFEFFPEHIDETNRICLALAAYYSGIEHVIDARKLAKALNKNPNIWHNNVEKAFLLLSDPEYYRAARAGYCDGISCINYVNSVMRLYKEYCKERH